MASTKPTQTGKSNNNRINVSDLADLIPGGAIRLVLYGGGFIAAIYLGGKLFRLLGNFNQDYNYFLATLNK
jgi:hypothetical protein